MKLKVGRKRLDTSMSNEYATEGTYERESTRRYAQKVRGC